jgi:hypothetical protein
MGRITEIRYAITKTKTLPLKLFDMEYDIFYVHFRRRSTTQRSLANGFRCERVKSPLCLSRSVAISAVSTRVH